MFIVAYLRLAQVLFIWPTFRNFSLPCASLRVRSLSCKLGVILYSFSPITVRQCRGEGSSVHEYFLLLVTLTTYTFVLTLGLFFTCVGDC